MKSTTTPIFGLIASSAVLLVTLISVTVQARHWKERCAELQGRLMEATTNQLATTSDHKLWFCRGAVAGVVVWENGIRDCHTNLATTEEMIIKSSWQLYKEIESNIAIKASQ
jgi:hypothetical protein